MIAPLHQVEPKPDDAYGAIAQIVSLPTAVRHTFDAEQDLGDITVGCVLEFCIERTQGEDEVIAL